MAVIMVQAINLGNHGMSETSDIPYHSLEAAHQQYLRLSGRLPGIRRGQHA